MANKMFRLCIREYEYIIIQLSREGMISNKKDVPGMFIVVLGFQSCFEKLYFRPISRKYQVS